MIEGACHCGAVRFSYPRQPEFLTDCNCSICRRYQTLWAYAEKREIEIRAAKEATIAYIHGDRTLAIYSCSTCACTTHWIKIDADERSRMAVNFRLCEPQITANIRVRKLDGADTWEFLD